MELRWIKPTLLQFYPTNQTAHSMVEKTGQTVRLTGVGRVGQIEGRELRAERSGVRDRDLCKCITL